MGYLIFFGVIYFIPAILISVVPNRLIWVAVAIIVLMVSPYGAVLEFPQKYKVFTLFVILVLPALIFKFYAVWLKSKGYKSAAIIVPFLGLAGPLFFLFNAQAIKNFVKEKPVPENCIENGLRPKIAGYEFKLSPYKGFKVTHNYAGNGFRLSVLGNLCKKTNNGTKVFPAMSLRFNADEKTINKKLCETENGGWIKIHCDTNEELTGASEKSRIHEISINVHKPLKSLVNIIKGNEGDIDISCNGKNCKGHYNLNHKLVVKYRYFLYEEKEHQIIENAVKGIVQDWLKTPEEK